MILGQTSNGFQDNRGADFVSNDERKNEHYEAYHNRAKRQSFSPKIDLSFCVARQSYSFYSGIYHRIRVGMADGLADGRAETLLELAR